MAMAQESWIMAEIGLGYHYTYYNGFGSCVHIRKEAARRLPEVIQAHHDGYRLVRGLMSMVGLSAHKMAISPPIGALIALVREAAQYLDTSAYSLTKTWQVISDVLEAHVMVGKAAGRDSEMSYAEACIDSWGPQVTAARDRIDQMGLYADEWIDGVIREKKIRIIPEGRKP